MTSEAWLDKNRATMQAALAGMDDAARHQFRSALVGALMATVAPITFAACVETVTAKRVTA